MIFYSKEHTLVTQIFLKVLKLYEASTIYCKDHEKKTVKNLIVVSVNGMFWKKIKSSENKIF